MNMTKCSKQKIDVLGFATVAVDVTSKPFFQGTTITR
jgi:hypothetical protein